MESLNAFPMLSYLRSVCIVVVCVFLSTLAAAKTVITAGTRIDGTRYTPQHEVTIVIEGDRIKEVVSGYSGGGQGDNVIDLRKATVLPGLIDCHVHLDSEQSPTHHTERFFLSNADIALRSTVYDKRMLLAGFNTVRNLGNTDYITVALRKAITAGYVEGPRIFSAGPAIGTTGGHADHTDGLQLELQRLIATPDIVDGADGARRVVRAHYKNGVNVIKIMTTGGVLDLSASGDNAQMTLDEIKAVVETAHDYGLKVAVHAHGDEGIRRAVLGGVDSIEHGTYLSDETMALMKERGTYLVPTIIAGKYVAEKAKQEGYV